MPKLAPKPVTKSKEEAVQALIRIRKEESMSIVQLLLTAVAGFVVGAISLALMIAVSIGLTPYLPKDFSLPGVVLVPLLLIGFFGPAWLTATLLAKLFHRALAPAAPSTLPPPLLVPGDTPDLILLRGELSRRLPTERLSLLSLILLSLFVLQGLDQGLGVSLLVLIVVIFFHEGGHMLGMLVFGYRDVRVFFLPFLGAAVTGRKADAPAWQRAVILLLGPLPGLVLGVGLLLSSRGVGLAGEVGRVAIYINIFNLLPLMPLDGGRLLDVTLFSRSRWLEGAFSALGGLAIFAIAVRLGNWFIGAFGVLTAITVPHKLRLAAKAQRLAADGLAVGPRVEALTSKQLAALDEAARSLPGGGAQRLPARAANIRALHERLCSSAPGLLATLLSLFAYGAAVLVSVVALALSAHWKQQSAPDNHLRPAPDLVQPSRR